MDLQKVLGGISTIDPKNCETKDGNGGKRVAVRSVLDLISCMRKDRPWIDYQKFYDVGP
jgi:hypothetical protein